MKIISLTAENIKKLVAVEIHPKGNLVQITGRNGQGKSSVLDSIWWALGGAENIQVTPIRDGTEKAKITLDLGEIVVTRTFRITAAGDTTSSIMVESAEGARFPSPQTMLDELLGHLTFDPLGFTRMNAKDQFNILKCFVKDFDFEKTEGTQRRDLEDRKDINRQAKECWAAAELIDIPHGVPPEAVDETELVNSLAEAGKHNADIQTRKVRRENAENDLEAWNVQIKKMLEEADNLRAKVSGLELEAKKLRDAYGELQSKLIDAPPLPDPIDPADIQKKIEEARKINAHRREHKKLVEMLTKADDLEEKSKAVTQRMADREAEKQGKIAQAKFPIAGISFNEDNAFLLNGIPFEQASDAEKLRTSVAIAMAMNPRLRVIRVRDGSLLDETSLKMIEDMAKEKDFQIWCEKVDSTGKIGIYLEDGEIRAVDGKEIEA